MFRIGQGYDVHQLVEERELILGGVNIPHTKGLLGHSDADVLLHAITDAILGALALGDIGNWFPDTDEQYKGADSIKLLEAVVNSDDLKDWQLVNLDATIMAQKPKLAPHVLKMRENIAKVFNCDKTQISIKATTTERLGFCGREEGIAASAVALLQRKS